jgi:hypothetical protein
MNVPVNPYMLAGRILAVLGMGLFAALAILAFVGGWWLWGLIFAAAFVPFVGLIVLVERHMTAQGLIGPEAPGREGEADEA